MVDPDVFVIQRSHKNNNFTVLERKLGDKQRLVAMTNDNVKDMDIEEVKRKNFCLDETNLLKLCSIGAFLEKSYESARDIEWAVYNVCLFS